jgi:hypothetical protein
MPVKVTSPTGGCSITEGLVRSAGNAGGRAHAITPSSNNGSVHLMLTGSPLLEMGSEPQPVKIASGTLDQDVARFGLHPYFD